MHLKDNRAEKTNPLKPGTNASTASQTHPLNKVQPSLGAILLLVFLVAFLFRLAYTHYAGLPFADPWRHMALIRNLRDGAGFTLFADQPYIWYSPVWYYLVALITEPAGIKWVSATIGSFTVPLFSLYLFRYCGGSTRAALVGGLLMAGFGPFVAFTCQLGAEAFSMFLFVCALLAGTYSKKTSYGFISGILFGLSVAARLQISLSIFLFFSVIKRAKSRVIFLIGTSIPLFLHWLRNYQVIQNHEFIFTWDGMATHNSGYGFFSTLAVQIHPSIAKATRELYENILPLPQWLYYGESFRWEIVLFFLVTLACVLLAKRVFLVMSAFVTVAYFLFFESTLSAHFFRIWLGLFPLLFIGVAAVASKINKLSYRLSWGLAVSFAIGLLVCGVTELKSKKMISIEAATPPAKLLEYDHYMVNSGFYHPESLIYRYPSKRFVGMPLSPERFKAFRKEYPGYRILLWRESFNVQSKLFKHLKDSGQYNLLAKEPNRFGLFTW